MNNGFSAALNAYTDLERGEIVLGVGGGLTGDAFSRPAPKSLADSNGAMTTRLLHSGKQVAAAEVGRNGIRDFSGGDGVDDACHRGKERDPTIGGDALPEVRGSASGRAAGGEGVKGCEGREDFRGGEGVGGVGGGREKRT